MSNKLEHSNAAEKTKTKEATWPDFLAGLRDKLSGSKNQVTYELENLNIFIPAKLGPNPEHFHWKIDGKIRINSEEQETNDNE